MSNTGYLASIAGESLPLLVLQSSAGFYIGTYSQDEGPFTRESVEYWPEKDMAEQALKTGNWNQRISS